MFTINPSEESKMGKKISPVDVVRLHPDQLERVVGKSPVDANLLEGLKWGFALHPEEARNTMIVDGAEELEIDWKEEGAFDDVRVAIEQYTVQSNFPIAGNAEHLISFRRLINAQSDDVRNGTAWQLGASTHLKTLFS